MTGGKQIICEVASRKLSAHVLRAADVEEAVAEKVRSTVFARSYPSIHGRAKVRFSVKEM